MSPEPIKTLLVEDNPGDARLVREALAAARNMSFEVEYADRLATAIERLRHPGIAVVLLDLSLPDSQGAATIERIHKAAPYVPIVALSGLDDEAVVRDAVKRGAEDYLIKGTFSTDLLVRTIRYAIDRKQAHDELAQARDSAMESARLRAEFLANMSHEIRTPLNGVIGMTRLLMDTKLTTEQRELGEIVRVSADTLLKIVNDILDFSKISAGKVVLEEADFDLGAAVESVVQLFAEHVQRKGIELACYVDGDVPVLLRGDSARLCQVLTNLVGNAIKFTSQGEVTVRVGRVNESEGDVVLRVSVCDTGIGIPLEGQRHLFRAFAQADGSTTRKYGGTGLGLAISAQLVELMGGNIGVQSDVGSGSTFWFTAGFRKQSASTQAASPAHRRLEGIRILVTDHSSTSARLVREHLESWRLRCETVASAAETLVVLKSASMSGDPFALALIDLQLPEMDGLVLARTIRNIPAISRTRLLGMYSLGGRPSEAQMKAAGLRAVLAKPIKQSQLFNSLTVAMAAGTAEERTAQPATARKGRRPVSEIKSRLPRELRHRVRILLVEDNLVNQQVALRLLERLGYKADSVTNGRYALEALERADYDIVLMDCQMPEMDGYTATREIRRREPHGRRNVIIGVTAHALAGDREECLKAGMDDYIAKPITPEDLMAMLDRWVEKTDSLIAANTTTEVPAAPEESVATRARSNEVAKAGSIDDDEVVDRRVIEALCEDEEPDESAFVTHIIGVFLEDLSERLRLIKAALLAGDANRVMEAAHALKGSSSEIGARRMRSLCANLEMQSRNGSLGAARAMLGEVEAEAARVRHVLEARLARASA